MQIACKYRSLSRYRSKRSLSLYIPLSRYVFFSHFHCTCPFLLDTLCFSLSQSWSIEEKKSKSRDKVSADEVVTEFFFIPRLFVFNPSKSSAAEFSTDIQVFRLVLIPANLRDTVCRWHSICDDKNMSSFLLEVCFRLKYVLLIFKHTFRILNS